MYINFEAEYKFNLKCTIMNLEVVFSCFEFTDMQQPMFEFQICVAALYANAIHQINGRRGGRCVTRKNFELCRSINIQFQLMGEFLLHKN